jgi:predicted aspartyl protease
LFVIVVGVKVICGGGAAEQVAIGLEPNSLVTVTAIVNRMHPTTMLLDTGSTRSIVSARVVRRLNLAPIARTTIVSATGRSQRDVVRLDALGVGSVVKQDVRALVADDAEMRAIGPDVAGIVGQDLLFDRDYTLDYERRRLSWNDAELDGAGLEDADVRLELKEDEGRWLAALPQAVVGRVPWFVPDSGASAVVIFDRGMALGMRMSPAPGDVGLTTVTGVGAARSVRIHQLRVGSMAFRHHPALVVERRAPDAPDADGLLPLSMFASVTFRARERVLLVRARRGHRR